MRLKEVSPSDYVSPTKYYFWKSDGVNNLLCPNGEGFHPHPLNCSEFYTCQGSNAIIFRCPNDEEWDAKSERCACSNIAQCSCRGDSSLTTPSPHTDDHSRTSGGYTTDLPQTTSSGGEDYCTGNEFYPCPWDCSKFFHCSHSVLYLKDCPAGLQWDVKNNQCDWPSVAQCTASTISYPETRTSSAPRSTSGYIPVYNPCNGEEFYPCPWDCSKFYHCDGAIAYLKDCPAGLEWDTKSNRCEWPINAKCSVSTVTYPGTLPTAVTTTPDYNPCHGKEFYPCPWDCSKYYHCDGLTPYLMDCPSGLEWDTKINRCEWPIIAKCELNFGN